jgi:hypothetical protein
MKSPSQMVPAVRFASRPLRSHPRPIAATMVGVRRPGVLLVGKNESWASRLFSLIERIGAEAAFSPPIGVTPSCIQNSAYLVVLLDTCVSPQHRKELAQGLIGTSVSLFYSYPVEHGFWWLPALRFGHECHGAPAFRSRDFLDELDRVLQIGLLQQLHMNQAEAAAEEVANGAEEVA